MSDELDPATAARIKAYAKNLMKDWPPLTEDQKDTIARILGGAGRRRPGGDAGGGGRRAA